jgi:hypothetical protein
MYIRSMAEEGSLRDAVRGVLATFTARLGFGFSDPATVSRREMSRGESPGAVLLSQATKCREQDENLRTRGGSNLR